DNPGLTTRKWHGPSPLRLVLDQHHRIPPDSQLFDGSTPTLVFSEGGKSGLPAAKGLEEVHLDFQKDLPQQLCAALNQRNIQSLIVEGGSQTLQSFIDAGLWDEARVFTGKV